MVGFPQSHIGWPDTRHSKPTGHLHTKVPTHRFDIVFHPDNGTGYVAIQDKRQHSAGANNPPILPTHEAEHAEPNIFTEVRPHAVCIPYIDPLTLKTKINIFPWNGRREHDVHPPLVLARCGIELDHLAVDAKRQVAAVARPAQHPTQQFRNRILLRIGRRRRHRFPRIDHQGKNVWHIGIEQVDPPGWRTDVRHASPNGDCRRSEGDCMRMVPAISSASFIAAVWVQYRCPIGFTT